jgi:hypothetical protein
MFKLTMQELLNFESFCHQSSIKSKIKVIRKLGHVFDIVIKSLMRSFAWR